MRIHAIAIKDFTCYEATTVGFDNTVNVIVSENAGGKTSLVDAITYCLTGHCTRTDGAGRGAEAMIRTGAREAGVGLKIGPDALMVSRRIPGGLSMDGHAGGQRELQDLLYETIGAEEGAVTAALNTSDFLCIRPDEQKALLFGLMGLDLSEERILGMITEEVPKQHYQAMCRLLDAIPNNLLQGGPAEVFAHLYEHYYNLRRVTKRQLKDLGEPEAQLRIPVEGSIQDLGFEIGTLQDLLVKRRIALDGAVKDWERGKRLEALISEVEEKLANAGDPDAAAKQLEILEKEISEAIIVEDQERGRADALREASGVLLNAERECPLAPDFIKCPLTKPKRVSLADELESKAAQSEKEADKAVSVAKLLYPRRDDLRLRAHAADKQVLEANLKGLRKEHDELPEEIDLDALEASVSETEKLLAEKRPKLEELTRAQGTETAEKGKQAERARLADEIEVLEVLVELTSPKGIPGRLLAGTIGPLEKLANERLSRLTGGRYQLRLDVDPDFSIVVSHDGAESDLKRLSSSERLRIGVILQDAVSRLSGLRVMMIDNADALDPQNRALLMDLLLEIKADYDSIIVLSTIGPNGVENPHIDDVTVYLIEDGKIEKVE